VHDIYTSQIHTYIHAYIHTYIHIYIHTYIQTQIHTRTLTVVKIGQDEDLNRQELFALSPRVYETMVIGLLRSQLMTCDCTLRVCNTYIMCENKNTYTHTHIRYIHTYINTCMHTYIHAYIHTNTHSFIHTYIHTYTHTFIHFYT